MAKRPGVPAPVASPMPWEDEAPTPAPAAHASAPSSGPMPWEDVGDPTLLTSRTAPSLPTRKAPPTWTQEREGEMATGKHPLWDKVTAYQEPDFSHPLSAAGTMFQNVGGRFVKTVGDAALPGGLIEGTGHFLRHPMDSAKSLVESISGQPYNPNDASIMPDPRKALQTGTELAAQAPVAVAGAKVVGPLTSAVGRGIKGAGRIAGEMTLGTDAMDRQGVRPGAGVSENRVVAASRPSLQRKLAAKIGPLRAQQMDVLTNSPQAQTANPIPTRELINKPFLDTIAQKTNYTTGAGSPPQMSQHWQTMEGLNYVQDPRGGILRDPVSHQPVPANIDFHTPGEAGLFFQNMSDVGNSLSPDTLAGRDIRLGSGRLSDAIKAEVPDSGPIMDRLNNTEAARGILERQRGAKLEVPLSRDTLTGLILNNVADPVRVALGSTAAAGLDLLGSGVKRIGDALTPSSGASAQPSPSSAGPAPQPSPRQLGPGRVIAPAPPPQVKGGLPGTQSGPLTRVVTRVPRAGGGSSFGPKVEAPAFTKNVGYDTSAMREGIEEENAAHNASRGPSLADKVMDQTERRKPGLKFEGKAEPEPNQGRRKTDVQLDEDGLPRIPTYKKGK